MASFEVRGVVYATEAAAVKAEAQLSTEDAARVPRGVVYATEKEATDACAAIDAALKLPNARMERWTLPVRLVDGWLVQQHDGSGEVIDPKRLHVEPESLPIESEPL